MLFFKWKSENASVPFVVPASVSRRSKRSAGYARSFSDDFQERMSLKLPTNPHKCGTTNYSYTLVEVIMVVAIVSFLMLIVMAGFQEMTKAQGVNIATRNLASKLILARSHAINYRQYVAILIPQCGDFPKADTNFPTANNDRIPEKYLNRSYRACIVGKNDDKYYFKRWVAGENWEFTPTGVAILEVDHDDPNGVSTTNGRLDPTNNNANLTIVSPDTSGGKGIDCSDIGGDNAVTSCAAIIFKPSGKSYPREIEIGEGVYSSGSVSLIMTNPSVDAYQSINIHQYTGRVAYEQGP